MTAQKQWQRDPSSLLTDLPARHQAESEVFQCWSRKHLRWLLLLMGPLRFHCSCSWCPPQKRGGSHQHGSSLPGCRCSCPWRCSNCDQRCSGDFPWPSRCRTLALRLLVLLCKDLKKRIKCNQTQLKVIVFILITALHRYLHLLFWSLFLRWTDNSE